jgi:hypothetical protein
VLSPEDIEDLNDPELRYVTITKDQLLRARAQIGSCEACDPIAEIPFDWLLTSVATDKGYVDYIIPEPAYCPRCRSEVYEKTLVEPTGEVESSVDTIHVNLISPP